MNVGQGYGTPRDLTSRAEEAWPYVRKTRLEKLADESEDDPSVADSRKAMGKRARKHAVPNDVSQQLAYRTGSFVNGSSRGLSGIMSGLEHQGEAILEMLVGEVVRSTFGRKLLKPIGTGGIIPDIMGSNPTARIRPGRRTGSKQGWFSPPPPKDGDPADDDHPLSLKDIALRPATRATKNALVARRRATRHIDEEIIIALIDDVG